jgi:hypothetical protein
MSEKDIGRRTFFKQAGVTALTVAAMGQSGSVHAQFSVPNSAGNEAPKLKAPPNACDCHHHLYDAVRFPPVQSAGLQPNARLEEYRLLQRRIGTTRNVIVTPQPYIGDNRITVDALARLGANARGVALLRPEVTDAELKSLTEAGICGLRTIRVSKWRVVRNCLNGKGRLTSHCSRRAADRLDSFERR